MDLSADILPDDQHLARVGRLQSITLPDELLALPERDRRWLKPDQLSVLHRARYERWSQEHPDHYTDPETYWWWAFLHDHERDMIREGTMSTRQRQAIAMEIYDQAGQPEHTSVAQMVEEMTHPYRRWWRDHGSGAAVEEGEHKPARKRYDALAPNQRARFLERAKAVRDMGEDWHVAFLLPDDATQVERAEPPDLARTYSVTDAEWTQLAPHFPPEKAARRNSTTWRAALDSALVTSCTRTAWRDIPQASAKRQRLQQAADAGTFAAIRKALDDGSLTTRRDQLKRVVEMMGQWRQKTKKA